MPVSPGPLSPGGAQPPDVRLELQLALRRELALAHDALRVWQARLRHAQATTPQPPGGLRFGWAPGSIEAGLRRAQHTVAAVRRQLETLEEAMRTWP